MLGSAPKCTLLQLSETNTEYRHRPVRGLRPFYAGFCLALPQICHKNRGGSEGSIDLVFTYSGGHLFFSNRSQCSEHSSPASLIEVLQSHKDISYFTGFTLPRTWPNLQTRSSCANLVVPKLCPNRRSHGIGRPE